jgi:hypothetical protein
MFIPDLGSWIWIFFHIRMFDLPDAGEECNNGEGVAHVAGGAGPVHDAHLRVERTKINLIFLDRSLNL